MNLIKNKMLAKTKLSEYFKLKELFKLELHTSRSIYLFVGLI